MRMTQNKTACIPHDYEVTITVLTLFFFLYLTLKAYLECSCRKRKIIDLLAFFSFGKRISFLIWSLFVEMTLNSRMSLYRRYLPSFVAKIE